MPELEPWILPITAAFAVVGTALVLVLNRRPAQKKKSPRKKRVSGKTPLEFTCKECQCTLPILKDEFVAIKGTEKGLVVRERPELVQRPLAEFVCPRCETTHCFAMDRTPPEWVGMNFYQPQQKSARCKECGKKLERPPWPKDVFGGNVLRAPDLKPNLGVQCPRCGAVTCVTCAQDATRNRVAGGYLCPRCFRGPMVDLYYF